MSAHAHVCVSCVRSIGCLLACLLAFPHTYPTHARTCWQLGRGGQHQPVLSATSAVHGTAGSVGRSVGRPRPGSFVRQSVTPAFGFAAGCVCQRHSFRRHTTTTPSPPIHSFTHSYVHCVALPAHQRQLRLRANQRDHAAGAASLVETKDDFAGAGGAAGAALDDLTNVSATAAASSIIDQVSG